MNRGEFNEWLQHHSNTFVGLADWLDGLSDTRATSDAWYMVLKDCDLEQAKTATDRLFADSDRRLFGWNDHPPAVAKIAREIRWESKLQTQDEYHSNERYKCHHCRDTGFRTVWHPKTMRDVLQQRKPVRKYVCSVACDCATGEEKKKHIDDNPHRADIPQYDAEVMIECDGRSDTRAFEYLVRNIDQVQRNTTKRMPNYDPTLADF